MKDRFESFTGLIIELSKMIQKLKNYEIEEYGLKAVHFMCIYYLNQYEEGLTSKELINLTLEDKAAVSRAISLLKSKDIITYNEKKYNSKIMLTDTGKEIAKVILVRAYRAVLAGGDGITEENRVVFYSTLEHITKNLEEYCEKFKEE